MPTLASQTKLAGTGDYGCRHVEEIISEYQAETFVPLEPLILISIARSYDEEGRSVYDAVRGVWRIDVQRAAKCHLVLAHRRGIVIGAFRPAAWLPATNANFPFLDFDIPGRSGFVGTEAEPEIGAIYLQKRVPDAFRTKGAANPIRFVDGALHD